MKRVFYDNKCHFCNRIIKRMRKLDVRHQFNFSSLDGKKAKTLFAGNYGFLRKKRSIVFLEGQRVWVRANAVFRLYWLLGGGVRRALGSLFVIPGFLINPFYRLLTRCVWR